MLTNDETSHFRMLVGYSITAGLILHQFCKRVDIDKRPWSVLASVIATHALTIFELYTHTKIYNTFWSSSLVATALVSVTLATLFSSILVYRAFFHPLESFPGPFGAKLSRFWAVWKTYETGSKYYNVVHDLHEKYGDYVRSGPREVMVFDSDAIPLVLGVRQKKGPFYGAMEKSISGHQDDSFHKERRKVWDMAFRESLQDYGPRIEEFTQTLIKRFHSLKEQPFVFNLEAKHYSYDVMAALAFGTSTEFIQGNSGKAGEVLAGIDGGVRFFGYVLQLTWALTLVETLGKLGGPLKAWNEWSAECVEERKKMTNARPDIMGHLLEHTPIDKAGKALLNSDSRFLIGAGSETTASVLSTIFPLLAHMPELQRQIREEAIQSFNDGTYTCQKAAPILDSIIFETLRIQSPALLIPQRLAPKGGLKLPGGVFIPEDTIIVMPGYEMHRDARYFARPMEFLPERWTTRPELILNRKAYNPFMTGPYACPGQNLAMMELHSVLSQSLTRFHVSFPEGSEEFTISGFLEKVTDHLTAGIPDTELVFTKLEE